MSFSFTSMVRLLTLLALGSTVLAIGVSRLDPPHSDRRIPRPVAEYNISDYFQGAEVRKSRWLNAATGAVMLTGLADGDVLESASCSPWTDPADGRQVVGRWTSRSGHGPGVTCRAFGLARYSFPEGRMIDQIATDIVPVGPPCWLPGTVARIVFSAGDGQLYRFNFEAEGKAGPVDVEPRPLQWACPRPGVGEVFVDQVIRPEDARLGGRLVATLRLRDERSIKARQFSRTQLWWLELDRSATRIVAAGPLLRHDDAEARGIESEERSPALAALPDGTLGLAYVRQLDDEPGWSLRLTRLDLVAGHLPEPADELRARTLAMRNHLAPLAFSPDGKWLNVLLGDGDSTASIDRIATAVAGAVAPPAS